MRISDLRISDLRIVVVESVTCGSVTCGASQCARCASITCKTCELLRVQGVQVSLAKLAQQFGRCRSGRAAEDPLASFKDPTVCMVFAESLKLIIKRKQP